MKDLKLIAIVEKIVEQKIIDTIPGLKGLRGIRGRSGKSFIWEEHEDKILDAVANLDLSNLKFKFEDFTEEDLELLKGPRGLKGSKGKDGRDGVDGSSFSFEEEKDAIELIITSYVDSIKESLKQPAIDPEELRGPRGRKGQKGRDGKDFNWEDHKEEVDTKIKEEAERLKFTFNDLTEEEKNELKLTFEHLTDDEVELLRGPRGRKGQKGQSGAHGQSAYDIWLNHGNIGSEVDFVASLIGAQGEIGLPGRDGKDGQQGRDGKDAPEIIEVSVVRVQKEYIKFVFEFSDGSFLETNKIKIPTGDMFFKSTPVGKFFAVDIEYDNTNCDLDAENVQDALDELCDAVATSATPSIAFGRSGDNVINDWLNVYGGNVRSHRTGIPFGLDNGELLEVWAGNQDVNTFDIAIYYHEGDSTNLTLLTTVSVVAKRSDTFQITGVTIPKDKQLAAKVTSGTCKNVEIFCVTKGNR